MAAKSSLFAAWALLAGLIMPSGAHACRCAPLPLADYAARADVIAQVEVQSVQAIDDGNLRATFVLLQDARNAAGLSALTTAGDGARCGVSLKVGQRLWIFGSLAPGSTEAAISLCDGSREFSQDFMDTRAEDVAKTLFSLVSDRQCAGPTAAEIAARIVLETLTGAAIGDEEARVSPNAAYRFILRNPTSEQGPPRVTYLRIDHERDTTLQLSLNSVNGAVTAHWVNEKMILVQAPWSGSLRSDVLLDVEAERLLAVDTALLDEHGNVLHWLDQSCANTAR